MLRMLVIFLVLWVCIALCFKGWRTWTKKEMWSFAKIITYAAVTVAIAVAILATLVALF